MTTERALVFAGSIRTHSLNRQLARLFARELQSAQLDTSYLDLRDYPMPLYDGDDDENGRTPLPVQSFSDEVRRHNLLVIASPEYNGSFSAMLKNVLDWISLPDESGKPCGIYSGKLAVIMSATPSKGGGLRGLKHLRELLGYLGVQVLEPQFSLPLAHAAFSPEGELVRGEDQAALRDFASQVVSALKAAMSEYARS